MIVIAERGVIQIVTPVPLIVDLSKYPTVHLLIYYENFCLLFVSKSVFGFSFFTLPISFVTGHIMIWGLNLGSRWTLGKPASPMKGAKIKEDEEFWNDLRGTDFKIRQMSVHEATTLQVQ
jgi:hypothetical protein